MTPSSIFLPLANGSWRRYLHQDDAPMLLERLEQERLVALWTWFQALHGGRSGAVLAEEAPIFDLILERLCEPVGSVEDGGNDLFSVIPARMGRRSWSRALFGAGLMFASTWLESATDEPFPIEANLDQLVEYIGNEPWMERARRERDSGCASDQDPAELTKILLHREPLLELPIEALARTVVNETGLDPWRIELPCQARALFFLGAIAAGLEVPETVSGFHENDEGMDEDQD